MKLATRLQRLDDRYQQWKADSFIFGDFLRPVSRNKVNIYYWKHGAQDNVGDLISFILVQEIVQSLGLSFGRQTTETRRLFAIGSILEMAVRNATVWGSGLRHSILSPRHVWLDIRAVRGPLTNDALRRDGHDCPEVFGDPAVLLPRFYQPRATRARSFLVIPHFLNERDCLDKYPDNTLSTLTADWKGFVDAIAGAELVISGSLHGVVLAEAYGVPAILLASAMDRDGFKYEDYYYGTGRSRFDVAPTVDKALAMGGQTVPALQNQQDALLKAFPRDLWES